MEVYREQDGLSILLSNACGLYKREQHLEEEAKHSKLTKWPLYNKDNAYDGEKATGT
jgi:hypothetical protein